ncbi:hypothetical protein Q3G72_009890 [Acer saccharum]|nr:hypothetical protein Q3G72_009890 [Acer saccharum]
MDQATETKNQVVDDDGGLKRTASRGSFQEPDAVYPAPPPAPADHGADISADLEAQPQPVGPPAIPVDLEAKHEQKAAVDYDQENLDWAVKMIGICLPPPVVIAVQYSLKNDQSHELPLAFHFLSLAIILFFHSLFLSKYLAPEFPKLAKRLGRIGLFFAVMAIYIAITIPLPAWLKCFTWTVFVVTCIAMVFGQKSGTRADQSLGGALPLRFKASRGSFQEPDTVYPAPPLVPVDHGADLEAQPQPVSAIQKAAADYDQEKLDWAVKMIGFCLPPAVVIAVQFLKTDQSHELPLTFHFLSLALILSFNSLFLCKSIAPKFPKIAKLFERVGVFLAVTAIYIAITIPLSAWLRYITWTVFILTCIAMENHNQNIPRHPVGCIQSRALSDSKIIIDSNDTVLPVLIVGGGPVGLVLSILLTKLGIKCSVLEKNKAFSKHPQARFINNRSLEVFRKLDGLAEEIERSQPPVELWRKFIYCTSLTGSILGSVDQMQPQDLEKVVSLVSVAHFS